MKSIFESVAASFGNKRYKIKRAVEEGDTQKVMEICNAPRPQRSINSQKNNPYIKGYALLQAAKHNNSQAINSLLGVAAPVLYVDRRGRQNIKVDSPLSMSVKKSRIGITARLLDEIMSQALRGASGYYRQGDWIQSYGEHYGDFLLSNQASLVIRRTALENAASDGKIDSIPLILASFPEDQRREILNGISSFAKGSAQAYLQADNIENVLKESKEIAAIVRGATDVSAGVTYLDVKNLPFLVKISGSRILNKDIRSTIASYIIGEKEAQSLYFSKNKANIAAPTAANVNANTITYDNLELAMINSLNSLLTRGRKL